MIWWLVSTALALEPPAKPAPPSPVDGECPEAYSVTPGRDNHECAAVALPLSVAADLYAIEKWSEHLEARYRIDTAQLESKLEMEQWRTDQLQQMLDLERQAQPIVQRPGVHVAVGLIGGVVVTVGAGWALQQVDDD